VNVLDRYIVASILKSVTVVMLVLLGIVSFVEFVGQLDDVGTSQYQLQDALSYVAFRIPRLTFTLLPVAALLGALLSLGNLAVHHELVVMSVSGVSRIRLMGAVGIAGLILTIIMAMLGDSFAPSLDAYGRQMRARAMLDTGDLATARAAWLKEGDDIFSFRREPGSLGFGSVYLFEFDRDGLLSVVARADSAEIDSGNRWLLANYAETRFSDEGVQADSERATVKSYNLTPELLGLSEVRYDLLSTDNLKRYIAYLEQNDLDAGRYLTAYWARMADIVSALLMTILALPFVSGGLRSAGAGARLMVGLVIGLGYYVGTRVLAGGVEVFDLDPFVVAWVPSLLLLITTGIALSRVR
jgi:lipopolysaccharide export system permease protein